MKNIKFLLLALILPLSVLLTGCLSVDGNFSRMRNEILSSTEVNFDKDVEFSLGSAGLSLARVFVKFDDDREDAKAILTNVSHVQVGVYKITDGGRPRSSGYDLLYSIDKGMVRNGWAYIVKSCEHGKVAAVYIKKTGESLKEMFVVSLDRRELSLVEIKGDLNKALAAVIRNRGINAKRSFASR